MSSVGKNTYVIIRYTTKNSNTAEHGFGDYPETIPRQDAIIKGDTPRKALNAFNKVFNKIYVGGRCPNGRIIDVKEYSETHERIYGKLPPYAYD
tara:strand:+ start:53 stop:334 length:282 start_codon:yes stop_codon:yes gene_type:complete